MKSNSNLQRSQSFLPTTRKELVELGWQQPDIILVTGDAYIDSPFVGVSVIGRILEQAGFKTAIIAQPDTNKYIDIQRLGEPALFWGITGGSIDSMVSNYTASMKKRKQDDYTPGGVNNLRPDRAVINYCNLIRRYFKSTKPLVIGGMEASLRRIAHYDYWSDSIRRSILFDAKADYLLYGMAEKAVLELAFAFKNNTSPKNIRGLCYISRQDSKLSDDKWISLPSFEDVKSDKKEFTDSFRFFYRNQDSITAKGLIQQHSDRYLIHNPPQHILTFGELDKFHDLPFTREVHPYYAKQGKVRAQDTIKYSIQSHRGCYGECSFCSIAVHQGRTVTSRSIDSIISEIEMLASHEGFKGTISDLGGPTANMYGIECDRKLEKGACKNKSCLFPKVCSELKNNHKQQLELLKKAGSVEGIKNIFIASGIRHDMILADNKKGNKYLKTLLAKHTGGQLKIAPEHTSDKVLKYMKKPGRQSLIDFIKLFEKYKNDLNKKAFLTFYLIAAHPGCEMEDMRQLKKFCKKHLKFTPEQVQIFTPLPSTLSALYYYTGYDLDFNKRIYSERGLKQKELQKSIITTKEKFRKRD